MINLVMADLQRRFDASPLPVACPNCLPCLILMDQKPRTWHVVPPWPCMAHIDLFTGRFRTPY
jgi:hypothetical protein